MKKFNSCLLVDDELDLLEAMKMSLDFMFENIDICTDGQQAIELLRKKSYEIIISDIQMPNMKGDELLRQIRKSGMQTPFIVISGNGSRSQVEELEHLGIAAYFEKPFLFEYFLRQIEALIIQRKSISLRSSV